MDTLHDSMDTSAWTISFSILVVECHLSGCGLLCMTEKRKRLPAGSFLGVPALAGMPALKYGGPFAAGQVLSQSEPEHICIQTVPVL